VRRRALLGGLAVSLAAPAMAADLRAQTLRFVPHQPLGWLDPSFWPFLATRTHAHMVYDTLYGVDAAGQPQPQMAEGHSVSADGLTWRIRLRDELWFHDGAPVLARDCVASIRRWGGHSMMGESLLDATQELSAPDDRTILFRLARRFALLPLALGDRGMQVCAIMPATVVEGMDMEPLGEAVGSGPYRFLAAEYAPWGRAAYARCERYVPRRDGPASFLAGPRMAHFDRVEWLQMGDAEATAAALRTGQVDWWELPPAASHASLAAMPGVALRVVDPAGFMGTLRMNHLNPPFNNPAVRRAVLRAIDQDAFMAAATGGSAHSPRRLAGFFSPGSPLAEAGGTAAFARPADPAAAREAVAMAGQHGAPIVVLAAADLAATRAMGALAARLLEQLGFAVRLDLVPVRGLVARLLRPQSAGAGGWSVVVGFWPGHDMWHPGGHRYLRATGRQGEVGWPNSEALEAMRRAWLNAGTPEPQKTMAREIQEQGLADLPYIPLGHWQRPTAHRAELVGMREGFPLFWNLRRG
jgi:peptide/nickel transport system substrate-binding protein